MKKFCRILITTVLLVTGCAPLFINNPWNNNPQKLQTDIYITTKIATRLTLNQVQISQEQLNTIENTLFAIKNILSTSERPNFSEARQLIMEKLDNNCQTCVLTIIDLIEKYVKDNNLHPTEDHILIIILINTGIDGALESINEFKTQCDTKNTCRCKVYE